MPGLKPELEFLQARTMLRGPTAGVAGEVVTQKLGVSFALRRKDRDGDASRQRRADDGAIE